MLYEMALTIGSHDRLQPLLKNALKSFLYYTEAGCGLIFSNEKILFDPNKIDASKEIEFTLNIAIGDHRIISLAGMPFKLPARVMKKQCAKKDLDLIEKKLRITDKKYKDIINLEIPGMGVLILLFREKINSAEKLHEIFRPVMANLAKSMQLCINNESFLNRLISEREEAQTALFHEKERAVTALGSISDGVITTDTRNIVTYINPVAQALCLTETPIKIYYTLISEIFRPIQGKTGKKILPVAEACVKEGRQLEFTENIYLKNNKKRIPIECFASPMHDKDKKIIGAVIVIRDVSKARSLMRELSWMASHDFLTGLVNRKEFEKRLEDLLNYAKKTNTSHGLLYLDLDQFKLVNDSLGHSAGDDLLKKLTSILYNGLDRVHTIARLGGDEFGILLVDKNLNELQEMALHLTQLVKKFRFQWNNKTFEIGVSIGIVEINKESPELSMLLGIADMACYAAKSGGRNGYHVSSKKDKISEESLKEFEIVSKVKRAIENNEFRLFCQPIVPVNIENNGSKHYEILLRMKNEDIGAVEIVSAAEKHGLMPEIDKWVIQNTFKEYSKMGRGAKFSINISGSTLNHENLAGFIRNSVKEFNVNPEDFCFEITETNAVQNLSRTRYLINELKLLGFEFSLDDFGSGISSFTYLKNLPVDYLKIDGSFVVEMLHNPIDYAVVKAVKSIGEALGIKVIAEYAQSKKIIDKLREIGVDYIQGNAISEPFSIESIL